MAHEIVNNQIAYVGATPWHGLGHKVIEGTTGEEMLQVAGLDWTVEARDIELLNGIPSIGLDKYKAIVRDDTNHVFSVQSDRYQPMQNLEIVNLFREYCDAGHAHMETVGAIRNGAIVWALASLNGPTKATLKGGDTVQGYIQFSTSHDGTLPTMGYPTQIRTVCANTFRAGYNDAVKNGRIGFRMKHSTKWSPEMAIQAKEQLGIAVEQIHSFNELSEELSNVSLDEKGRIEFVSRLLDGKFLLEQVADNTIEQQSVASGFASNSSLLDAIVNASPVIHTNQIERFNRVGKAILEAIVDSPGSELESAHNTLWGAVNGVSYYTDHLASRTQDSRLYNSWFGNNESLKESAIHTAMDIAGISR